MNLKALLEQAIGIHSQPKQQPRVPLFEQNQLRQSQPIQQFEDGSSLVGQRGGRRIGVPVENGQGREFGIPHGQQRIGSAGNYSGMQLGGQYAEDDYTPAAALEQNGYYNPQTTQHGAYRQGNVGDNMQGGSVGDTSYLRRLLGY